MQEGHFFIIVIVDWLLMKSFQEVQDMFAAINFILNLRYWLGKNII